MSATLAQVAHDAFELPNNQRLTLAGMILQADDGEPSTVEQVWDAEIRRRIDAYDRGELHGIPFAEVKTKARARRLAAA